MKKLAIVLAGFVFASTANAQQSVWGKVEAIWTTPAGFVIDMDDRDAVVVGRPPSCGAGHALSFHVKDVQIQALAIAAASSNTQIYVEGSRSYCGPFDSQHPDEAVQLAESVTWVPESCENASKCAPSKIEKFIERAGSGLK